MLRLYTLLWYLALPFVTLAALRRARRERHSGIAVPALSLAQYWRERRGFLRVASSSASATSSESDAGPVTPARARPGTTFWVHAASVGEVQLAALLIKALRERPPARALALSCQTATASARAQELLPDISLCYAPYDLPAAVHRRFQLLRPAALVLIETELWPNLLAEAARQHLPVLVASARLSARSARTYRTLRALLRPSLERTVWVGAQTAADAERFSSLGVPAARLTVTGNLKFDCPLPPGTRERGAAWRARLGQRPVWVAGSTHPAEQTILLEAHRLLSARHPEALLVMVPRHPPRFEEAAAQLQAGAWRFRRRSRSGDTALPGDCQVLLIDTLGELLDFYAAADVAFIGGSLVPIGGHNLLEPAALGLPLLTGPHQRNSPEIARALVQAGALDIVSDAQQLSERLLALLDAPALRAQQGAHACAVLESHRGALERVLGLIERLPALS